MTSPANAETTELAAALRQIAALLVVSARGLVDEPPRYGPMLLLDAAGRLVDALEDQGLSTPDTEKLREGIESVIDAWGSSQEEFVPQDARQAACEGGCCWGSAAGAPPHFGGTSRVGRNVEAIGGRSRPPIA